MTNKHLIPIYQRLPVAFSKGQGIYLWDTDDNKYLDAVAGIAVCSLGHAHPAIIAAIQQQAPLLIHTSNVFEIPYQQQLAQKLTMMAGMSRALFCNSGAEANEAAIKLARLHAQKRNIEHPKILVMSNAFHGRTLATLSASAGRSVQAGFEPLVEGFIRIPFNDTTALYHVFQNETNIVAVFLEPILGAGGIAVAETQYLQAIEKLCQQHQALLMIDEVQSGVGRTGKMYCYQHYNVRADVVTTAKALGNGIPIGACLVANQARDLFLPGMHGTTFGGNPFCCRVALTVLDTLKRNNLIEHAAIMGKYLQDGLREQFKHNSAILAVRGKGLMVGIEFDRPCKTLINLGLKHGLLLISSGENVIRLLPPLIIQAHEIDELIDKLACCVAEFT